MSVILILASFTVVHAQLYKWKDKNGVIHYSNVPRTNEEVAPEVIDREIKYSDEYYREAERRQEQISEQQRREKESMEKLEREYKRQKDEQKKMRDEIEKRSRRASMSEEEDQSRNDENQHTVINGEWDTQGRHYAPAGGDNKWRQDGTFMQKAAGGYIDTKTGRFVPSN